MKKHLIAAAVAAAVAVPAAAQVTVSGTIDTGFGTQKITTAGATSKTNITGVNNRNATNVINFAATEDLGGGMRAEAFMSQGLNTETGSLAGRDTWAALQGGFGRLQVGRFTSTFETTTARFAVTGTTNTAGTVDFMFGSAAVGAASDAATTTFGTRVAYNSVSRGLSETAATGGGSHIQYTLPTVGGLTVAGAYAARKADWSGTAGSVDTVQTEITAVMAVSPILSIGLGVLNQEGRTEAATPVVTDIDMLSLGAEAKLGALTVKAGYIEREQKASNVTTKEVDANVLSLGVAFPVGATTLRAEILDGEDKADGTVNNKRDYSGHQLSATYAMSKRTSVYALSGATTSKGNTTARSTKREDFSVGLRHTF